MEEFLGVLRVFRFFMYVKISGQSQGFARESSADGYSSTKWTVYIGIMKGWEGAENQNCLVVNDARDRKRARGNRQGRSDRVWDCEIDSGHAAQVKVIK
jgi:hypothetical protein